MNTLVAVISFLCKSQRVVAVFFSRAISLSLIIPFVFKTEEKKKKRESKNFALVYLLNKIFFLMFCLFSTAHF